MGPRDFARAALAMALICGVPLCAAELRCKVRSVAGAAVIIACDAGASTRVADELNVGFEAPGAGFIALVQTEGAAPATPPAKVASLPPGPTMAGFDRTRLPPVARRPWLGATIAQADSDPPSGVLVQAVAQDSPAAQAGIRAGDVIVAVAGVPTLEPDVLLSHLATYRPGDAVEMQLRRGSTGVAVKPVLGETPLDDPAVQRAIAHQYLSGMGVPQDLALGIQWLERAAAQGHAESQADLEELRRRIAGEPATPMQAPAVQRPAQPSGVFIAGKEKGKRPGYFAVEPAVRSVLIGSGARLREWPPDFPFPRNAAPEPEDLLPTVRSLAGGWLLYLEVEVHWSRFTFAADVARVRCFDPAGRLQWKEEAANRFANSAGHSLQIVAEGIARKLIKRRGQACLRP